MISPIRRLEIEKLDKDYSTKIKNGCIQDDLLCELLSKLGFSDTVEAFQNVNKYYA